MNMLRIDRPRVLLVEDDVLIGSFLADILDEWGFECIGPLSDLTSALHKAETERIDVALLDVILSDRYDYEVMEVLEARGIPFGFLSAVLRNALPLKWRERPLLEKPCGEMAIVEMLRDLLATRKALPQALDRPHSSIISHNALCANVLSQADGGRK